MRMLEVENKGRKIIQETHVIVAVNLIMKARLNTKLFFWKLVLFACEWKLIFIKEALHLASLS